MGTKDAQDMDNRTLHAAQHGTPDPLPVCCGAVKRPTRSPLAQSDQMSGRISGRAVFERVCLVQMAAEAV
ncbi:hypothetical protein JANAI62_33330 [Jannaschia pagri]|uniref:Uncharacterized protein n=1 Tax=Jannaschia pagri TaxID=2829797 RepID=A0ABQ4NQL9_9RHOB|nr:hypothetical protein JANAI62_33330 [Jannaschia sp. AI_62]